MKKFHPKQINIIGSKNSGKTEQMEFLIKELTNLGYKVGAIKHTSHPHPLDKKGSDSEIFFRAGASASTFYTDEGMSIVVPKNNSNEILINYVYNDCDILFIESFKKSPFDKIIINPDETVCNRENIIAVITETGTHPDYKTFQYSDTKLVEFIINKYLSKTIEAADDKK